MLFVYCSSRLLKALLRLGKVAHGQSNLLATIKIKHSIGLYSRFTLKPIQCYLLYYNRIAFILNRLSVSL